MPKIIIQSDQPHTDSAQVTLNERIVAENLHDHHYAAQLIQRLGWATADAEELESPRSAI